jgi:hypothetical protein
MERVARRVHGDEDDENDYFRLGIAELPDFSGWQLMFLGGPAHASYRINEAYALETETGAVAEGGLASVTLTSARLRLEFSEQAARQLELTDTVLDIRLDIDRDSLRVLADGLARVFAGTSASSRPSILDFGGLTTRRWLAWRRRRRRKAKARRVVFEVYRRRGTLVDAKAVNGPETTWDHADHLARQLGLDPNRLIGCRYACTLTPDPWGITYSLPHLVRAPPDPA